MELTFGWWWADPLAALAVAALAIREGLQDWTEAAALSRHGSPTAAATPEPAQAGRRSPRNAPQSGPGSAGPRGAGLGEDVGGHGS